MSMPMISKRPSLSVSPSAKPMVLAAVRSNGADELPRRDALEGWRGKADIGAPQRGPVAGVGEHQVEPAIAVDVHSVDRATAVDIPAHRWPRAIRPRLPRTSRYLPSCFSDRNFALDKW